MQRTVALTLRVAPEDAPKLERTRAAFAAACDWISGVAYAEGVFNTVRLHHRTYYEARGRFAPLQSQFVVRAIGVVADAYRRDRTRRHRFRPDGAVVYDERLLRFEPKGGYQRASLTTVDGRIVCRPGHRGLPAGAAGPGDEGRARPTCCATAKGRWRLHLTVTLPDPPPAPQAGGVLGVDLGIMNLAVDSDGTLLRGPRQRAAPPATTGCASSSSPSAPARPASAWPPGGGSRPASNGRQPHGGQAARGHRPPTHRALAVEDLNGIRDRPRHKASRDQRRLLGNWGFFQLRTFLEYKAQAAGLTVYAVDPRHTCRPVRLRPDRPDRTGRPRPAFVCVACGFAGHADHVAATNIARRGARWPGCLSTSRTFRRGASTPTGALLLWRRIVVQGQAAPSRGQSLTAPVYYAPGAPALVLPLLPD